MRVLVFRKEVSMPSYLVERSIFIDAPPEKVFEVVSDFGTWTAWSPWLIAEPDAKVTVSDDRASVGSTYAWEGEVTGAGGMTHQELTSPSRIVSEIRFLKPFKSVAEVGFDLTAEGSGTKITWSMNGSMPWFLFWMIPSLKSFIGMDYVRGLKMLKEWIETGRVLSDNNIVGPTSVGPVRMAGVRQTCEMKDIGPVMNQAIEQAKQQLEAAGLCPEGRVMAVYHGFDVKRLTFDFTAGYMIDQDVTPPSTMSVWAMPESQAFQVTHTGRYEHMGNPWSIAHQHIRYRKLKQQKIGTFEIYHNCPDDVPEEELLTDIYLPLR